MEPPRVGTGVVRRLPPGLVLLLTAPLLGELVSGHQTPRDFFNPLTFILLCLPYGFGAVLCREALVRWKRGWPSLVLLALAYGLYEEGLVVRSFFNSEWAELTAPARAGYLVGVNWTYAFGLLHFHVLISIIASVKLVEVVYPERRRERWVGRGGLIACGVGLLAWWPWGWVMTQYQPSRVWHVATILLVAGLVLAARFAPRPRSNCGVGSAARPVWFFLLGLVYNAGVFILAFMLPDTGFIAPLAVVPPLILLAGGTVWLFVRWSGNAQCWDDRHRLAGIAGLLAFFIAFGVLADLDEQWTGKSAVSLVTAVALWQLWRSVTRRERPQRSPHAIA
jgi:hypothetical protein